MEITARASDTSCPANGIYSTNQAANCVGAAIGKLYRSGYRRDVIFSTDRTDLRYR